MTAFPGYIDATCPNCEQRTEIHRSLFPDGACLRNHCERCGNDFCVPKPEPENTAATEKPRLVYTTPSPTPEGEKVG